MKRRTFLALAGTVGASGAIPFMMSRASGAATVGIDARLAEVERAALPPPQGSGFIDLPVEIVRAWRAGIENRINIDRRFAAYTKWDLSILLTDLARESGFAVSRQHVSGGVFLTAISVIKSEVAR